MTLFRLNDESGLIMQRMEIYHKTTTEAMEFSNGEPYYTSLLISVQNVTVDFGISLSLLRLHHAVCGFDSSVLRSDQSTKAGAEDTANYYEEKSALPEYFLLTAR